MTEHPPATSSTLFIDAKHGDRTAKSLFTGGSVIGALAMSSCCIMPLVLFSLGISGAWIGNLTALYPYKPLFFIVAAAFLGGGFYTSYRKPQPQGCAEGGYCVSPVSERINRIFLWSATVLVLAALIFPYVAPSLLIG